MDQPKPISEMTEEEMLETIERFRAARLATRNTAIAAHKSENSSEVKRGTTPTRKPKKPVNDWEADMLKDLLGGN